MPDKATEQQPMHAMNRSELRGRVLRIALARNFHALPGATGCKPAWLCWLALLILETPFRTPWGALGALAGAGVGWLTLSDQRNPQPQKVLI